MPHLEFEYNLLELLTIQSKHCVFTGIFSNNTSVVKTIVLQQLCSN